MRDGFVLHGAEGALGGVVGTLLIRQTMALGRRMPAELQPPSVRADPGELIVSRVEALRGRPLPWHDGLVSAMPWAYGIAWGGLLGIAVDRLHVRTPRRTLLAGAGVGALVWAVGYAGWLPRAGLTEPLRRQGAGHVASSLATHVLYGVAAAVPIALIDRARRRRRPWWQRAGDALRDVLRGDTVLP